MDISCTNLANPFLKQVKLSAFPTPCANEFHELILPCMKNKRKNTLPFAYFKSAKSPLDSFQVDIVFPMIPSANARPCGEKQEAWHKIFLDHCIAAACGRGNSDLPLWISPLSRNRGHRNPSHTVNVPMEQRGRQRSERKAAGE